MSKVTPQTRVTELVKEFGSFRNAAREVGINYGYLYRIYNGERTEVSDEVLARLGISRKVKVTYERLQIS